MISFDQDDWSRIRQRYADWWDRKTTTPVAGIAIRREGFAMPRPITQENCNDLNKPAKQIVEEIEQYLSTFDYYGDAFPYYNMDCFGPGVVAAMLGAKLDNSSGRVWFAPEEIKEITDLHFEFDPNNKWFLRLKEIFERWVDRFGGQALLSMPDLGGVMDILSSFRPSENLMYDLYDYPEEVSRAVREIEIAWDNVYRELAKAMNADEFGYTDWSSIYSAKSSYVIQCDFSYMIGGDMFDEFVLDTLKKNCETLHHTLYHLDGKGELKHTEKLLAIPGLDAIQWVGAGAPTQENYPELYHQILDAGKQIQVNAGGLEVFKKTIDAVGTPGAFLHQILFQEKEQGEKNLAIMRSLQNPDM